MARSRVIDRDRGWAAQMKAAREAASGAFCKVGILGDNERGGLHKTNPNTGKAEPLTVAEIAVVNEFGDEAGHIPSRSFVRSTFDRMREELADDAAKLLIQISDGKMTVEQALNILGLKLATAIRHTIVDGAGVPPPNAPSTARQKARGTGAALDRAVAGARPLVDTGAMLSAIAWAVVIDGAKRAHKFLTGK